MNSYKNQADGFLKNLTNTNGSHSLKVLHTSNEDDVKKFAFTACKGHMFGNWKDASYENFQVQPMT
jgi:hypothetical protein